MERIVHKAKSHKEARDWDIKQVLEMSPDQRQQVAKKLKERFYGNDVPDVKSSHKDRLE